MAQRVDINSCIEISDLKIHLMLESGLFPKSKVLKAVDRVSSPTGKGRTVGLMGESGCGKAAVDRTTPKLYQATADQIPYQGTDITGLSNSQMAPYREKMQMTFQDPYTSLDPRKNIGDIIAEPIWVMELYMRKDKDGRVRELIEMTGLKPDHINQYPHESSGGQGQRIGIARILVAGPESIAYGEPISALDVSIQAQVTNILEEPQDRFYSTYLFISHNLFMMRHISSEVGIMYLGNLTEHAQVDELYDNMLHPYTQSLISTVSVADPKLAKENKRIILKGNVSLPINPTPGCPFRSRRCYAKDIYSQVRPGLKAVNDKHKVACHLFSQASGTRLTRAKAWGQKYGARST